MKNSLKIIQFWTRNGLGWLGDENRSFLDSFVSQSASYFAPESGVKSDEKRSFLIVFGHARAGWAGLLGLAGWAGLAGLG